MTKPLLTPVLVALAAGAPVLEEGQLVDPSTLTFQGLLRRLPDTTA